MFKTMRRIVDGNEVWYVVKAGGGYTPDEYCLEAGTHAGAQRLADTMFVLHKMKLLVEGISRNMDRSELEPWDGKLTLRLAHRLLRSDKPLTPEDWGYSTDSAINRF
jgi:hypothetical protein